MKTIETHEKQLVKSIGEKDSTTLLKPKNNFDKIINERPDEKQNLSKQTNYNDLKYYFKTKESSPKYFIRYKPPLGFLRSIKDSEITTDRRKKSEKILHQI